MRAVGMVRRRVAVSLLHRLDTATANVLRFTAPRVKLIGVGGSTHAVASPQNETRAAKIYLVFFAKRFLSNPSFTWL